MITPPQSYVAAVSLRHCLRCQRDTVQMVEVAVAMTAGPEAAAVNSLCFK